MTGVISQADRRLELARLSGGISSSPIYAAAIREGRIAVPDPSAILDFGSGTGSFIPRLRDFFPRALVSGLDIAPRPQRLASEVEWHRCDLNEVVGSISDQRFDLIFAIEVIEHLENPRHVLRELGRMLVRGGAAVLTTPNLRSIKSQMTFVARGHHALFDDSNYPAHITPVAEIDIGRAADEAGLTVEKFFYTDRGTIPKLLNTHWQQIPVIGSRLRGRWFSDNVGAVIRREI